MRLGTLPYQALVLDLGGVIVGHDNAVLRDRLVAACTLPGAAARVEAACGDPRYGTGALPISALHEALRRDSGYGLGWDDFRVQWCSHLWVDEPMLAFVRGLAETNRVMLFSNTNREHWEHLVAATGGALGRLEAYLSHEIGVLKPAVEAFQAVAARAGIEPSRSLFVDDVARNVEGARGAGFEAVQFTGQPALEAYLERAAR